MLRAKLAQLCSRDGLAVALPLIALIVGASWLAYLFVKPAPPSRLVITTGTEVGSYHTFAERYRAIFARNGITLDLRASTGSVANLERLLSADETVNAGFLQAGVVKPTEEYPLLALGAVYYEPVWVFYRAEESIDRLKQLEGKRISIGPEGSGTRHLALELLRANAMADGPTELLAMPSQEAAEALLTGKIDAFVIVTGPETGIVRSMLYAQQAKLLSFNRSAAYTRLFPHMVEVTLPAGSIDLVRDLPGQDTRLIATTAQLVVREDTHPALIDLLMQAAHEVHGRPGPLQRAGDFPSARAAELPLARESARFYRSGPPLLQRYLPFWAATFVDRILIPLVPLVAVLLPALRFAPAIYTWRVRAKIARFYGQLKLLEHEIRTQYDESKRPEYVRRLAEIEDDALNRAVPLGFTDLVYILREHIGLVRGILDQRSRGEHPQ